MQFLEVAKAWSANTGALTAASTEVTAARVISLSFMFFLNFLKNTTGV
jgi:hypothetical protein